MTTMKFSEYLRSLRESRGMTKADLARACGVTNQYFVEVEAGRTKPPTYERCEQIAKTLELSEAERKKLVQLATLERASNEARPILEEHFRTGGALKELPPEAVEPTQFERVPVLGEAPAGDKAFSHDEVEEWIALPRQVTRGRRMYLLRVRGDSMVGAGIKHGDVVIVDAEAQPEKGHIVVARVDGETTIKKFYRYGDTVVLEPANPKYEKKEYSKENEVRLRGVVQGVLWKGFLK